MNSLAPFDERNWKQVALEYLIFLIAMILAAAALIAQ